MNGKTTAIVRAFRRRTYGIEENLSMTADFSLFFSGFERINSYQLNLFLSFYLYLLPLHKI